MSLYKFDGVIDRDNQQRDVFDIISDGLEYENDNSQTILAYGHTGSGKTHTVFGSNWVNRYNSIKASDNDDLCSQVFEDDDSFGVIQRTVSRIMLSESKKRYESISCGFFQIYNEKIIDLLSPKSEDIQVKLSPIQGVVMDGLTMYELDSCETALDLLMKGYSARKVRDNSLNKLSSRSHTIFQLRMVVCDQEGDIKVILYIIQNVKLNFCDLAGSERYMEDIDYTKEHLKELKNINLSLSTLSKVILQLSKKSYNHFHFRESKLTRVLQDSLDGRIATILLATLSPSS